MGPLTEAMTRLCGEIVAGRGARLTFVKDLTQDVAAMKAHFRQEHDDMARHGKAERRRFVKGLEREVAKMQANFRKAHATMARKTGAERRAAVAHLKMTVGGMRREFAADLLGARRAWFGPSPAERRAMADAARRAKEEADRRAREAAERAALEEAERQVKAAAPEPKEEPGRKKKG